MIDPLAIRQPLATTAIKMHFSNFYLASLVALASASPAPLDMAGAKDDLSQFAERQGCQPSTEVYVDLVGDGSPYTVYKQIQVGSSQSCTDGTCGVNSGETIGTTVSADIGFGGGPDGWITGGFSVTFSRDESIGRNCGGDEWDVVCQRLKVRHTAYQVKRTRIRTHRTCQTDRTEEEYEIRSPDEGPDALEWWCDRSFCNYEGSYWWDDE